MKVFSNPTRYEIKIAAKALKDGNLVAFPTETVYGLGADAENEKAVSRIYSVKGRPIDHPLIVHISNVNQLGKWATNVPDYANKLARELWPGPMTLILKRSKLAKDFVTGKQDSVGLRVPIQSVALSLLKEFEKIGGQGVAAPSANKFGAVSPTTVEAVYEEIGDRFGTKDLMLDSGQCLIGIESTIIDCTREIPRLLRPGAVTADVIQQVTGIKVGKDEDKFVIKSSGLLESHYAPRAKILLNSKAIAGQGFIALSKYLTPRGAIRLAAPSTTEEFAQGLYMALRLADQQGLEKVAILIPEGGGLADAILDRLTKASAR